ncbi:MAG: hypothetical protein R3268_05340 [Acidiferrobacterales bacterium]|nr:hypothetical protein [Acidiferrobacterales bacterium]
MYALRAVSVMFLTALLVLPVAPVVGAESDTPILSFNDAVALLGKGVVGKTLPDGATPDVRALLPTKPGSWTYKVVSGKEAGSTRTNVLKTATDKNHPGLWQRHDPGKRVFSIGTSEQALTVESLGVFAHNLLIEYLSGEPLVRKGMNPGDKISHKTDVRAVKLNHPSHVRSTGYLDITVTYMGRREVTTPAGHFDTYLIRRDITSDVSPVKQTDTIYAFYAENVGIVAQASHLDVHAAFIYRQDTRTGLVLQSLPNSN